MRKSRLLVQKFSPRARDLRAHFDERFSNPHGADSGRFVWDYWHVPGQYTVLRTPAYHFFPPRVYRSFHEELVLWGRRNLGCHDISPPWLSSYVDGCRQEFHADLPHGPWAFVFSLTNWDRRRFTGGETLLMREPILDYWRNLDRYQGLEEGEVLEAIPPRFNQLAVFDPRIPHGVRRVDGVWEPRDGRLVVHGWFVQPRPFIEGPLRPAALQEAIDELGRAIGEAFGGVPSLRGMISFRFEAARDGSVHGAKTLCDTLVSLAGDAREARLLEAVVRRFLAKRVFPKAKASSTVTLPLVFEA